VIEKIHSEYFPVCDNCEAELERTDSFDDAVAEMKDKGWEFKNYGGVWTHLCPKCQAEADFG